MVFRLRTFQYVMMGPVIASITFPQEPVALPHIIIPYCIIMRFCVIPEGLARNSVCLLRKGGRCEDKRYSEVV